MWRGPVELLTTTSPQENRAASSRTLTLPAGSYTLSATVSVGRTSDDDTHVSCGFTSFGTLDGQGALASLEGDGQDRLPLIGDVTIASNGTSVFLQCAAIDGPADAIGEMIATPVGGLTSSP